MANGKSQRRTHEVRLGLVMYGGVSLAVYINGVANELFRAVRGRGVYRLLKELTDSDIAVDVVSGASAGGINGILLGFALCNDREFGPSTQIWREGGDIGSLLRNPSGDDFPSLLDSEEVYQPLLEKGLERMWATPIDGADDDPSAVRELDLFVTGTDYNGRLSKTLDEAGHSIDVKDHRALFWLKHRQDRKEQLHPAADGMGRKPEKAEAGSEQAGIVALAKLARITSCFPAAFAPVVVPARGKATPDAEADEKLRTWGKLERDRAYCFLDGGVLDNKPFTSTLRTIFYRTTERPVRRHVLYVEPDPERFQTNVPPPFRVPSFTQSALDSLTKLPGYESIADDLRLVAEHNDKIDRLGRLRDTAAKAGAPSTDQLVLWRQARLSAFRDAVVRRLLGVESGEHLTGDLAARADGLRTHFDDQYRESDPASEQLLQNFDVDLRLRRLFHLTYTCADRKTLSVLNGQIEFLEIARHAMEEALSRGAEDWVAASPGEIWRLAFGRLTVILQPDADGRPFPCSQPKPGADPALSAEDLKRARDDFADRLRKSPAQAALERGSVLTVSDDYERATVSNLGPDVQTGYASYQALDAWLFPLEFVANLHERDVIRVTRLSPVDAQRGICRLDLAEKLSGDSLAHFGAFFKRSWRSNDILWGRLDGACQLVETLAERGWLTETLSESAGRTILGCDRTTPPAERSERVLAWLEEHEVFPLAGNRLRRATAEKLARLLDATFAESRSEKEAKAAIGAYLEAAWSPLVDAMVQAAHIDILDEGLPLVVEDEIVEQKNWGNSSQLLSAGLAIKDVVAELVAKHRKPGDSTGMKDLLGDYHVGSETIAGNIPRAVLLELGGRAALVAQNCLVESIPRAEGLREKWVFRIFFTWPLRVFHATANLLRHSPKATSFVVVSAAYFALAIVVNVLWHDALYVEGTRRQVALFLFVVVPAVLGFFSWLLIRPFRSARRSRFRVPISGLLILVVIGLALVLTSKLLDTDFSPYCSQAPFSTLGERCSAVARTVVLLVPLAVGLLLGAIGRPRKRSATFSAPARPR